MNLSNPLFKAPDRRYKLWRVRPEVMFNLAFAPIKHGNRITAFDFEGLPDDVKIAAMCHNAEHDYIVLRLWSSEWPEVLACNAIEEVQVDITAHEFDAVVKTGTDEVVGFYKRERRDGFGWEGHGDQPTEWAVPIDRAADGSFKPVSWDAYSIPLKAPTHEAYLNQAVAQFADLAEKEFLDSRSAFGPSPLKACSEAFHIGEAVDRALLNVQLNCSCDPSLRGPCTTAHWEPETPDEVAAAIRRVSDAHMAAEIGDPEVFTDRWAIRNFGENLATVQAECIHAWLPHATLERMQVCSLCGAKKVV